MTAFVCRWCETEADGYSGKKFCSKECRVSALTASNSDPEIQRSRGRRGGIVRGAQRREARASGWYLKDNGEHTHRTVAAEVLGRDLLPGEVVHHEDRNKINNDPRNLIVFEGQGHHARHHKLNHENHEPCQCAGIRLRDLI